MYIGEILVLVSVSLWVLFFAVQVYWKYQIRKAKNGKKENSNR